CSRIAGSAKSPRRTRTPRSASPGARFADAEPFRGDPVEQSRTSRGRPNGWVSPPRPCPAPSGGSKRNWAPPFGRNTHRVTLTRAGTVLLDQARIALDALDAAARRAQRAAAAEPELVLAARGARDRVAAAVPVDGHLGVRPYRC